jgi:hypothetical protein
MEGALITVVETKAFTASAKGRMEQREVDALIDVLATEPECGDLIRGTGGLRKVRFGAGGKGKRGSVRVVYYFYNDTMPVFLLTVFAKNEKDNLSRAERNTLAKVARTLGESYGE